MQFDNIEHVRKFNPYHDSRGRFSNANGSASFTYKPGKSKAHDMAIAREKQRQATVAATQAKQKAADKKKAQDCYDDFDNVIRNGRNDPSNATTKKAAKVLDDMPKGASLVQNIFNSWHTCRSEYTALGNGKWDHSYYVDGNKAWGVSTNSYGVASDIRSNGSSWTQFKNISD